MAETTHQQREDDAARAERLGIPYVRASLTYGHWRGYDSDESNRGEAPPQDLCKIS